MPKAAVDGIEIYYEIFGSGPPLFRVSVASATTGRIRLRHSRSISR